MDGLEIGLVDWMPLIIAIAVTVYVARVQNPFEKGTDEYQALRICRIGLVLLAWVFGFGIIGLAFALTAFVLGIVGIIKGRGLYGTMLIIGAVVLSTISIFSTLSMLLSILSCAL